jgi:N-acetylglucosamine-6-sulfatase
VVRVRKAVVLFASKAVSMLLKCGMAIAQASLPRRLLKATTLAVCLAAALAIGLTTSQPNNSVAQTADKPNIVVVMTDDQDTDSLKFMPEVQRRVMAQGITFKNTFSSQPLCCPNRTTFLTGRYVHNHGINANNGDQLRTRNLDSSTVATWLNGAGYRTGYFGKYVNGYNETAYIPPGWDRWYAFTSNYGANPLTISDNGKPDALNKGQEHEADRLSAKAVDFLQANRDSAAPLFMVVAPNTPHLPTNVPDRYAGAYSGLALPRPPNFNEADVSDKAPPARKPRLSDAEISEMAANYRRQAAALRAVDDMVASLMDELSAQGELDNTYILYTSDNGYYWGEHRYDRKTFPYEAGAHQPLVIRGPRVETGTTIPHLVGMHDLAPTIAALASASPTRVVDGKRLLPLFSTTRPTPAAWRQRLLVQNWNPKAKYYAVRNRQALYVEYTQDGRTYLEHYYLSQDPYQLRNDVASLSASTKNRLHDQLVKLRNCQGSECRTAEGS